MKCNQDRAVAILVEKRPTFTQVLHLGVNGVDHGDYATVARCASVYAWLYEQPRGLPYSAPELFENQDKIWEGTKFEGRPVTSQQTIGRYLKILEASGFLAVSFGRYGGFFIPSGAEGEKIPQRDWDAWETPTAGSQAASNTKVRSPG
jgi:hypothetical protein